MKNNLFTASTTIALTLNFAGVSTAQDTNQGRQKQPVEYPYGDKFQRNIKAEVTEADQRYHDYEGNEFTMIFTSTTFPNGREVEIDPDDMMPLNHPKTDHVTLSPRTRFLGSINAQLPAVPGAEIPAPKDGEGLGVRGAGPIFLHLTSAPSLNKRGEVVGGGHGISPFDLQAAMWLCFQEKAIPAPAIQTEEIQEAVNRELQRREAAQEAEASHSPTPD